jgi:DNA repair protein SbcD/Mre11
VTRLLCAADIHIGRAATRLGAHDRYRAGDAWLALVQRAVDLRVDGVLLAGDVLDQDSSYFEAAGLLDRGLRKLRDAGIPVVAVSGNHDHSVLHQLAGDVGDGHLVVLGRGGVWERHTLRGVDGVALAHIHGWSFPAALHGADPVGSASIPSVNEGVPLVGLLHCELDSSEPRYAPVPAARLNATPMAAWILGHIHVPRLRQPPAGPAVLYPGSLLPLDPGEIDVHGAWLLELTPGSPAGFTRIPLAPVRYGVVHVDLEGVSAEEELRGRIVAAVREALASAVVEHAGGLEVMCCRLRVTGRTPLHGRISQHVAGAVEVELVHEGGARAIVDQRYVLDTSPAYSLADLAAAGDAAGLLARLILDIDAGRGMPEPLRAAVAAATQEVTTRPYYSRVHTEAGAEEEVVGVERVRRQAAALLEALIRQKEVA